MTLYSLFSLSLQGVQSPLYVSCLKGNIEMVQLLVHHHAAIDQPTDDVSNALYNSTSLSLFCSVLFTESPAYSVLFTSSLLSCSPQGGIVAATPLMAASGENHIEVARFLVEHGASIDYQNQVFDILFLICLFHNLFFRLDTQLFKLHVTVVTQILSSY